MNRSFNVHNGFQAVGYGRRYLDDLFKTRCGSDLLQLGLYPNAKEWTESCAAWHAAWTMLKWDLGDKNTLVVVPGDGCSPRTAAMFSYRSAWTTMSIDPRLRDKWCGMNRVGVHATTVEAFLSTIYQCRLHLKPYRKVLVAAVHSHAPLGEAVKLALLCGPKRLAVIAIPCCVPQKLHVPPDIRYIDRNIWSPENEVLIWKNVSKDIPIQGDARNEETPETVLRQAQSEPWEPAAVD
jgi:hypothetical protein